MKKLLLIVISSYLIGCNNSTQQTSVEKDNPDFFPVNSFLKGQVYEVDSLNLPVYKYTKADYKTDTILLSRGEFDSLAEEFMKPDINDPSIKKFYKETSFADQSIPNVTFTYSTINRDLPLQRLDVIIRPDSVSNDRVQSIYLEKISKSGDTVLVKKLYWKMGKNFQIISSIQKGNHPSITSQVKVEWDAE